jgi:hypothetical protein
MNTYRIISCAVHLGGDDPTHKLDGVVDNPVDLGAAPEGVGILNPVAESMAL